jgi:hypothetical protein
MLCIDTRTITTSDDAFAITLFGMNYEECQRFGLKGLVFTDILVNGSANGQCRPIRFTPGCWYFSSTPAPTPSPSFAAKIATAAPGSKRSHPLDLQPNVHPSERWASRAGLVQLYPGFADHFAPARDIVAYQRLQLLGRAFHGFRAESGERVAHRFQTQWSG